MPGDKQKLPALGQGRSSEIAPAKAPYDKIDVLSERNATAPDCSTNIAGLRLAFVELKTWWLTNLVD
jgi:hypothetical protein